MMRYGTESETTELDNMGSTLTLIRKVRDYQVATTYKKFSIRVKVRDSKEEMAEYIKHTDSIREKKEEGVLVLKESADYMPTFIVEYPKFNEDGSYFIIKSWTEYIK
jgi:hypothetical protein